MKELFKFVCSDLLTKNQNLFKFILNLFFKKGSNSFLSYEWEILINGFVNYHSEIDIFEEKKFESNYSYLRSFLQNNFMHSLDYLLPLVPINQSKNFIFFNLKI